MAEEIIIFYPPGPINIDIEKIKTMKEIEIILYNKTNHKVLYKINSYDDNIFKINNLISVIKPLSCTNIKIFLNYKTQINLTNNKYEIKFDFYILNDYCSNFSDLNALFKEKKGNEIQQSVINIYLLNNKLNIANKEQKYIQDIKNYSKFKNDLIEINNKLKNIINSNKNNNNDNTFNRKKNKFKIFLFLLLFVVISGFIFGIILSRQYKKLFKKEKNRKIDNNKKEEEEFIDVKFMSVKEADEIKQVNDENLIKFKELNNFNILNEAKRNRELIKFNSNNAQKAKKTKKEEKKNFGNIIKENIILIYILLIILI